MAKAGRKATAVLVTVIALAAAANTSAHDDPIAAADQPGPTLVLHVANYAALPREVLDVAKARVAGVYEVIGVRTVWDDRGEAVSRLQNGELHVTVHLVLRAPRHSPSGIMRASLAVRANDLQSFNRTEARTIRAALMTKK